MITLLSLGLYPSSGGPSKSIKAFREALGAEVVSWVDPGERQREDLIWDESVEVVGSNIPVLRQLQYPVSGAKAAEDIIAQSELVSVHSFWRWHIKWIHEICQRHRVPYWFVPHGSLDPYVLSGGDSFAKRLFMTTVGAPFLRDAAAVIYSTTRELEKARRTVGHDRAEIVNWPLGEVDFFERSETHRRDVRSRLGISQNDICFLYLGRLSPMKRPLETIEAFSRINLENTHLIVVGNDFGVTAEECREAAMKFGVDERCHVVGPAYGESKQAFLSASDIYVSLSARENFNFTAAEALSAGLRLVLSPGNDLGPEIVELDGVELLGDGHLETATMALRTFAQYRDPMQSDETKQRRKWAQTFLNAGRFQSQIQDAANRFKRAI